MKLDRVTVREAQPQDYRIIAEFVVEIARESEDIVLDPETVEAGVRAVLEDRAKGVYYVAEADEGIIGQTLVTTEWSDWNCCEYWWLQSVYVVPERRRSGIFSSIYRAILTSARDASATAVRLYVHRANEAAVATYECLGMKDTAYTVMEERI